MFFTCILLFSFNMLVIALFFSTFPMVCSPNESSMFPPKCFFFLSLFSKLSIFLSMTLQSSHVPLNAFTLLTSTSLQ